MFGSGYKTSVVVFFLLVLFYMMKLDIFINSRIISLKENYSIPTFFIPFHMIHYYQYHVVKISLIKIKTSHSKQILICKT